MLRSNGSDIAVEILQILKSSLQGEVLVKGEASEEKYRHAIARWNMMHVKEANIIVFPQNEYDVSITIKFATEHNLDVTVSAGRHTYSGASSGYGLVIDLRKMRNVLIDRAAKTAIVGGGCIAGDVEQAADNAGLRAVFGGINATGVGGITTGGGIGQLSGQYGLAADNLLAARVALADGRIVVASPEENADLFWGIRGGGGNFGICTEFTFQLHESRGLVYSGMFFFAKDQLRECIALANRLHETAVLKSNGRLGLMLNWFGFTTPEHVPAWIVFYDGPEEEAKHLLQPLFELGPINVHGGMIPYPQVTSFEPVQPFFEPDFNRYIASSVQMPWPLHVDVVEFYIQEFDKVVKSKNGNAKPSFMSFDLRDYRKVASLAKDATAYVHRVPGCMGMLDMAWNDPSLDEEIVRDVKRVCADVRKMLKNKQAPSNGIVMTNDEVDKGPTQKVVDGHVEINTSRDDDDELEDGGHLGATTLYALLTNGKEKMVNVFGSNYPRLRELKSKYDPDCMWNKWYPIEPAIANKTVCSR